MKAWATEQYKYQKSIIEKLSEIKDSANEKLGMLQSTKQSLERIFKGLPLVNSKGSEARKEKHNRHKAHKRKNVRLDNAKQRVCQAIIKPEFESGLDASNCITREMLILEAISKLRRDWHQSALEELLHDVNWGPAARQIFVTKLSESKVNN